jgi:hypothetical protein
VWIVDQVAQNDRRLTRGMRIIGAVWVLALGVLLWAVF